MKIRYGFVSNSSTTSFSIYGTYIEELNNADENDDMDWRERLEEITEKLGLFTQHGYEEGMYVGRQWSSIKDDETGAAFKKDVQEKINQLPIPEEHKKCSSIEEAWRDG